MRVKSWQVGAGLAVALAVALPLALWRPSSSVGVSGPRLVPLRPGAGSRPPLGHLVKHYSAVEDACALPGVEQIVRWHGLGFDGDLSSAPERPLPSDVRTALRSLETEVALSRPGRTGRPWVLLLPEVHEHEEREDYVLSLAQAAAHAFKVRRVRVFVEAWSQEVQLDPAGGETVRFSGLEPTSAYPWSRAAWGLLDLAQATRVSAEPMSVEMARQALLGQGAAARLRVGQHSSREAASRALALYARAWNALCARFSPHASTRARLPVAADYLQDSHWVELAQEAQLTIPGDPADYRPDSPLATAALTLAAVTSRVRTTEFAIRVLETTGPADQEFALLQIGANHVFPLVDLLQRAGWGWGVLLSPSSRKWIDRGHDWRCPVASLPKPLRTGFAYFRLPASPVVRKNLRLREVVDLQISAP